MELFIRIQAGQPFEHPIIGDNFRAAFPNVDVNNLPPEFARFVRVEPPVVGVYEMYDGVTYEWQSGLVTDVHHLRPMTPEEVATKQQMAKDTWARYGYASWVFDEATCAYQPPTQKPADGKYYRWDEPTTSWIEVTNV
jgi:hypothetical protein